MNAVPSVDQPPPTVLTSSHYFSKEPNRDYSSFVQFYEKGASKLILDILQ